uniref:CSON012138 protein n=1 Tax=Culicoides sonorensis TaxID=179676 RepID=A0A336M8P0_CULSO
MRRTTVQAIFLTYLNFISAHVKQIKLEKNYQCKNEKSLPNYLIDLRNLGGTLNETMFYFKGNFTVMEEIFDPIILKIYVVRCPLNNAISNPDKCQNFVNQTIDNLCEIFVTPNMLGNRYLSAFKPPMRCPIKPGLIDVSKADMILNRVMMLPIEGYRWTLKLLFWGVDGKSMRFDIIGCLMVHLKVTMSSNSNKIKRKNQKNVFIQEFI